VGGMGFLHPGKGEGMQVDGGEGDKGGNHEIA
jgi:hypothetical protein